VGWCGSIELGGSKARVAVGGSSGTLSEVALARRAEKPVICIKGWRVVGGGTGDAAPDHGREVAPGAADAVARTFRALGRPDSLVPVAGPGGNASRVCACTTFRVRHAMAHADLGAPPAHDGVSVLANVQRRGANAQLTEEWRGACSATANRVGDSADRSTRATAARTAPAGCLAIA
jgi:hypothetical protein